MRAHRRRRRRGCCATSSSTSASGASRASVGFLRRYLGAYLPWRLRGYPHWAAYRRIPHEVEAEWIARRAEVGLTAELGPAGPGRPAASG